MSQIKDKIGQLPLFIYYHTVSDRQLPHLKYLIRMKSSKELEADLDYLGRHFDFISLAQCKTMKETGQQQGKRKLVLTFDDGYSEVSDIVQPVLIRKGIPAAFFIASNFLNNQDLYYRCKVSMMIDTLLKNDLDPYLLRTLSEAYRIVLNSKRDLIQYLKSLRYDSICRINDICSAIGIDFNSYLSQHTPYLSKEQIQNLLTNGFEIGAHSIDHPFFGKISVTEQLHQTKESMDLIQQAFSLPYRYFALPHSDSGITAEYFHHARDLADILLGGYGIASYPHYHYYQRFSIEKYQLKPSLAMSMEYSKVVVKKFFVSSLSER